MLNGVQLLRKFSWVGNKANGVIKNMNQHAGRLQAHYKPLLEKFGSSYQAVNWGSAYGQELRFKILLEVADVAKGSILDVGCGVGQLVEYLQANSFAGTYCGVDLLPEMVKTAAARYPHHDFAVIDVLQGDRLPQADFVFGSGLFYIGNQEIMERTVQSMFASCHKAAAFNTLSTWASEKEAGEFYADPGTTLEFCRQLTPWVRLRHDYMEHDFTVYMYKQRFSL